MKMLFFTIIKYLSNNYMCYGVNASTIYSRHYLMTRCGKCITWQSSNKTVKF